MAEEEDILERVERALAGGEVWRAKEILRGNIGNRGYSPRLYERYGRLLLDLGDKYEAGKYLFLSAQRCADYEGAISLYLDRVKKSSPRAIFWSFPKGARFAHASEYPEPLRTDLEQMGLRGSLRKIPEPPSWRNFRRTLRDRLLLLGCGLVALAVILSAITGFNWLVSRIFGR